MRKRYPDPSKVRTMVRFKYDGASYKVVAEADDIEGGRVVSFWIFEAWRTSEGGRKTYLLTRQRRRLAEELAGLPQEKKIRRELQEELDWLMS